MDGTATTNFPGTGEPEAILELINEIASLSGAGGFRDPFKKDCSDLTRRISLLSYLVEEIREFKGDLGSLGSSPSSSFSSSSAPPFLSDLEFALQNAKRLLLIAATFNSNEDDSAKKLAFQFQCVTWKLEKALDDIPYDDIGVSEEVQEQVELVRTQLKRATEKHGPLNPSVLSRALSQPMETELDLLHLSTKKIGSLHIDNTGNIDYETEVRVGSATPKLPTGKSASVPSLSPTRRAAKTSTTLRDQLQKDACVVTETKNNSALEAGEGNRKPDAVSIPEDFLCPISLEIMRDPVIVATGQTYERSYIQRWIDSGNLTCPKTQQKLQNFTLTPNYVLRSLISQWCLKNNIEPPTAFVTGKLKKSDGSFRDVSGDIVAIQSLVRNLTSRSLEECRAAVREIRFLSKRSTDNRILIAEAGAIPVLVNLSTSNDVLTQENAVTAILNLSIYENNKELIMLAGATTSIVQVLRNGSMEARENAAATLFSLSLADENKIIIGASGAIPALVELLQSGSPRGKKDAATALFNLCIYQGNKGRAVRAGIITALLKMLTESNRSMVDEALTILSVLGSHLDAKVAIVKAGMIPVMVDLVRTGLPRNKENAAAILLALCKRDLENLGCLIRLGASVPLNELAKSGTERAKRKATSLLELLRRLQQQ
ncbi:hypothetical protein V2J09_015074 [Rumex salicifolius]